MNVYVILYLFYINSLISGGGPPQNKADSMILLEQAYNKKDYDIFFRLYPNSYTKFVEYYGYIGDKPMPLYSIAFEHLKYLMSGKIRKFKLIDKLFNIAKDGKWDADASSYLQDYMVDLIVEYPEIILSLLNENSTKEIENFWYFILYYPSLHPEYDLQYQNKYKQIYNCIQNRDKQMGGIIKKTYEKIVAESNE